jgi:hypothetical protein
MSLVVTVTRIDLEESASLEKQRDYARKAVNHGLIHKEHYDNGNSPFNGDLIYSQMFDTSNKQEKEIYNQVSNAWKYDAKEAHVYIDLGLNSDMVKAIEDLEENGLIIKYKTLSNKKMIQTAVKSLKTIEDAASFLISQQDNLVHSTYQMDYTFSPKNEVFAPMEYKPCHYEKGEFKRIILESPFAGEVDRNVHYAKALIHKLAHNGYAPSASHLLYTQCLDDTKEFDRDLGINKGLDYAHEKDSIIGIDLGISGGMKYGIARAERESRDYRFETLSQNPEIIKEVTSLRDLKDAEEYTVKQEQKNDNLFKRTGYLNPTFLSDGMLEDKINITAEKKSQHKAKNI